MSTKLRKEFAGSTPADAMNTLLALMRQTESNEAFVGKLLARA